MSLYRYVGSKDELLVLMLDFAVGAPPEIATAPGEWREGLRQFASAERRLNHRRPWLARVPISGPPAGPNQIAWLETALRILRDTGLGWAEKVGIMTLISGYVRHMTLLSQDLERGRDGTGLDQAQAEQRYGRSLAKLIEPDRFPEMAQLVASGIFEPPAEQVRDDPAGTTTSPSGWNGSSTESLLSPRDTGRDDPLNTRPMANRQDGSDGTCDACRSLQR
jgi:AcrR family transcriptional regulator